MVELVRCRWSEVLNLDPCLRCSLGWHFGDVDVGGPPLRAQTSIWNSFSQVTTACSHFICAMHSAVCLTVLKAPWLVLCSQLCHHRLGHFNSYSFRQRFLTFSSLSFSLVRVASKHCIHRYSNCFATMKILYCWFLLIVCSFWRHLQTVLFRFVF